VSDLDALAAIKVENHGLFALHNFPCPVCREKHAVLDLSRGVMEPCWTCQEDRYQLVRLPRWVPRWLARRWVAP
jgi:hypothetical protein